MAKVEKKKTIFFTQGMSPTDDEYKAAEQIGPGVVFRNARKIVPGAPLENCDAVAGDVPDDYKELFSKSEEEQSESMVRPNPTRTPSSGGPDDFRPGTVDDGIAHESGTGSTPVAERREQRTGLNVWEKPQQPEAQENQWPGPDETGRDDLTKKQQQQQQKQEQQGKDDTKAKK